MKASSHNGRGNKHGAYTAKHNDRRFDVANSEHISSEREKENIYWDCYRGYTNSETRGQDGDLDFSFDQIEYTYYYDHYGDHIKAQNDRNDKQRHSERNKTVGDVLKNIKTCPEESIYQLGDMYEHATAEDLVAVFEEFLAEMDKRYGEYVHTIDWALHVDEATPHIHARRVFDCPGRYGDLAPQQEKALEKMGIPLPHPDKPKGKNNNRKMSFDAECRKLFMDFAAARGIETDRDSMYGGRDNLEKKEYQYQKILERISDKNNKIAEKEEQLADTDALLERISEVAVENATKAVTESVQKKTLKADLAVITSYEEEMTGAKSKNTELVKKLIRNILSGLKKRLIRAAATVLKDIESYLQDPEVRKANVNSVKEASKASVLELLAKTKKQIAEDDRNRLPQKKNKNHGIEI